MSTMDNNTFELHPLLKDASLDKAAKMANSLVIPSNGYRHPESPGQVATDLSFMLEYLRLNFDLVPKP